MLQKCILKSWAPTRSNACAVHIFLDILGFLKSFQLHSIQLTSISLLISSLFCSVLASISLLIVLISSFFCWILVLFSISFSAVLPIVLHHIFGVSSFDFVPEGAGWLHHWTKFQLISNLIYLGHLVPILSLSLGASHHSGHHVPPLSGIFVICFICWSTDQIL